MSTGRRGTRWIAAVLGVALIGSAVVFYLLIRVTAPTAGSDAGLTAASTDPTQLAGSGRSDSLSGTAAVTAVGPSSPSPTIDRVGMSTGEGTQDSLPSTPFTSAPSIAPTGTPSSSDGVSVPASTTQTEPPSLLPGSSVPLPAAWSGTATVDITMTGACPGATPSHYQAPAAIALDVAGGGASVTQTTSTSDADEDTEPTLTIGVNGAAVPSVTVYSASVDNSGVFHRFWALTATGSGSRTLVSGTVVDDSVLSGDNPNVLVDALQPPVGCVSAPVTGLPRVLAVGSTLSGWVDANAAEFTLKATTTDGQRAVTITVTATRRH